MKLILVTIVAALFSCSQPQQDGTTAKRLTPTEYKQQATTQQGVVIDVRTQEEFASGHLQGAEHADLLNGDFAKSIESLDKDKTYYLYCKTGNRSGKAAKLMQDAGFKNVFNIGGYEELKSAGLPTKE